MSDLLISSATGILSFGAACMGSLYWGKKREKCRKKWQIPAIVGVFALLAGMAIAVGFLVPSERVWRQAEQYAVLAGVAFCAVTDLLERIIPNPAVLGIGGVSLAFSVVQCLLGEDGGFGFWLDRLFGLLLALAVMGISALLVKDGIGGGDLKLLTVLGFVFGAMGVAEVMFFTFLPCALCSLVLLALKKGTKKTAIPLGPFLVFGVGVVALWYRY